MRLMLITIRLLKVILRYVPYFTRYLGYTLAWFLSLSSTNLKVINSFCYMLFLPTHIVGTHSRIILHLFLGGISVEDPDNALRPNH